MNAREILELMPKRRLLRSQSVELFFKLDDKQKPTIAEILNQSLFKIALNSTDLNNSLTQIDDPTERAEAYKELCFDLKRIISAEREENLKHLAEQIENVKNVIEENESLRLKYQLIYDRISNIDELKKENSTLQEQLLNSKARLDENNIKFQRSCEILSQCKNVEEVVNLNQKLEDLKEENEQLILNLELLKSPQQVNFEEKVAELNSNIQSLETELDKSQKSYCDIYNSQKEEISELKQKIKEKEELISALSQDIPKNSENKHDSLLLNNSKMELTAKDVILAIPSFTGDMKQFEGFINTCELYYSMVQENQKATVLKIIKAKISGEAMTKAGPFDESIDTWEKMKKKLKSSLKKPVTIEYAQEDLNTSFQGPEENIENYGSRMKAKLKKLNEASRFMTEIPSEFKVITKMNEKQAISKFEQNLRNPNVKVLVSAAQKQTLDECIAYAMQKEMIEKNKNIKSCNYCGLQNHDESSCRKKIRESQSNQANKKNKNTGGNFRPQNSNKPSSSYNSNQNSNNNGDQKPPANRFSNSRNQNADNKRNNENKDGYRGQQKNVKPVQYEDENDEEEITVREVLESNDEQKN